MGASVGAAIDTPDDCQMTGAGGDKVSLICRLRTINSELDTTNFSVIPARVTISLEVECSDVLFFQSALRNKSFVQLTRLRQLQIEYCKIGEVPRDAFAGLGNLQNLTLKTFNTDCTLPPELFKENKRLTKLYARNNSITVLAPGLFTGLYMLLELNLADNDLTNTWVNSETFMDLLRLASLDLSHNKISRLDAATFRDLTNLQVWTFA
ncbi:hypothetical protein HAZT_HAZT003855 [Hyalella azteca]|uniref:LRRNT domain-containing protein n=1 Tax=Hyalella azteca TaxID=294128 RepID=A0A6A0GXM1_HYAAZ|nr:hypothetical protein HAZT_HAZT003855 [Hyalella azteca]